MPGPHIAAGPDLRAPGLAKAKDARRQGVSAGDGPDRVLLLHGLSGSPHEIRPFAGALAADGLAVRAPLLPGHDSVEALAAVRPGDWTAAARAAFDDLARGARHVFVVGFSMGALLALHLCAERGPNVAAAVCLGTPLRLAPGSQLAVAGLRRLHRLVGARAFAPVAKGLPDVRLASEAVSNPGLMAFPTPALAAFAELQRRTEAVLGRVTCPLAIVHGRLDHTAPVGNVDRLAAAVGSAHVEVRVLPRSFHLVGVDLEADLAVAFVRDFLRRHRPADPD